MAKNISSKTPETKMRTLKDKLKIDCKDKTQTVGKNCIRTDSIKLIKNCEKYS